VKDKDPMKLFNQ